MISIPDSERLTFRLMTLDDADLFVELDNDPAVMQYINGGHPTTRQEIEDVALPRLAKYLNLQKGWGLWHVATKSDQQFLGWILVRPFMFFSESPQWHNLELGWRFKRLSWGKGYAIEAAKQVLIRFAEQPDVEQFCAIADENNLASIALMKKLGMTFVKKYLHEDPIGNMEVVYYQVDSTNKQIPEA